MTRLVYDAGALLAAERRDLHVWALHDEAMAQNLRPVVPAVVLGQAWRGGPQPLLSRLLAGCLVESFDEAAGRAVGRLLRDARAADVVDAHVVLTALRYRAAVVTSDAGDLQRLIDASGRHVPLHGI